MPAKKKARKPAPARGKAARPAKKARRVNPIPKGFHTVTSYLFVPGGAHLIEYLRAAFIEAG